VEVKFELFFLSLLNILKGRRNKVYLSVLILRMQFTMNVCS